MDFSDGQTEGSSPEELFGARVLYLKNKKNSAVQEKLTLLLKSTVRGSTLYPLCQFETLHRSVSMRGSRVKVGSAQRARSAPPVELRQSSGAHGRCNNSAH